MADGPGATPRVRVEGKVAVLHLGAGENRFNGESVAALDRCLDEVEAGHCTALVTTAGGKIYSNGLDVDWLLARPDEAGAAIQAAERLLGRLLAFPLPTVAAMQGHAFAAGAMFALAHDIRLMRADRGYFCLPEVDLGVTFTPGMMALIQARLSPQAAHRAAILGQRFGAPEALAAGMVDEAVALEDLPARALEVAGTLGGRDRAVVAALKQSAYREAVASLGSAPPPPAMLAALRAATGG